MECLLFVLADCELDANEAGQTWYRQERVAWSMSLERILDQLEQFLNEEDEKDGMQEEIEARESLAFADGDA